MSAEFEGVDPGELEQILANVQQRLQGRVISKALRASARPVIKAYRQRITPPGYDGDKPNKRSLRSAIGYKGKKYGNHTFVGIVGARVQQPWGAAHAHLYDQGHKMIVSRGSRKGQQALTKAIVPGKAALAPAVDTTMKEQQVVMVDKLKDEALKASQQ